MLFGPFTHDPSIPSQYVRQKSRKSSCSYPLTRQSVFSVALKGSDQILSPQSNMDVLLSHAGIFINRLVTITIVYSVQRPWWTLNIFLYRPEDKKDETKTP